MEYIVGFGFLMLIAYFIDLYVKERESSENKYASQHKQPTRHATLGLKQSSVSEISSINPTNGNRPGPWDRIRTKVIARDGNKCTMCGATKRLQVDHIQELKLGGTNALRNLRTLCVECHEERHGRNFTRQEYYTDRRYGENYRLNPKVTALKEAEKTGVGIKYKDRNSRYSERVIYPNRIWSDPKTQRIYVKAYDELDRDERVFKLSRMKVCNSRLNFYADGGVQSHSDVDPDWLARNQV